MGELLAEPVARTGDQNGLVRKVEGHLAKVVAPFRLPLTDAASADGISIDTIP